MLTIARLFGKSPFSPLQSHMKKVNSCIKKLTEIFELLKKRDFNKVDQLVHDLSKLEHEADLTKNDIRNHLPKSLFLPIDRSQLLDILSIQDNIADKAEEIGNLITLQPFKSLGDLLDNLCKLYEKNIEAFSQTYLVMKEMNDLLESSFGGLEAEKVKAMIDQTSYKEYEADKMKHKFMKEFFEVADTLSTPAFYLYVRLIEEINHISHISESLANRIRMILELK
ncbi:MAG: TIGR00153 family protein [Simkaniaceae bacterium]|nr:TIGR00153 family protein [Simkaniaceae bacterium]